MDLQTIRANVLVHLQREAGTTEYWDNTSVDDVINFLYRTLARQYRNVKDKYSRNSVTTVDTVYKIPANFLAVNECSFDGENLDPISVYEIRLMDSSWRTKSGDPDYFCLDYRDGFLLLWYYPSTIAEIEIIGPIVPENLSVSEIPSAPYSNGLILEPGAVSFLLAQEGGGQNLERSSYWYDIFVSELDEFQKPKQSQDHCLRSIENKRGPRFGPRLPSNYPAFNWRKT